MSATETKPKRAMQVANMMTPEEIDALYGYEPTAGDRADFFFLAVEETPGAPSQHTRYQRMGYIPVTVICENPRVTIMKIPHEKRELIFEAAVKKAQDNARAADANAKNAVSGAAGNAAVIGGEKSVSTGQFLTLPTD